MFDLCANGTPFGSRRRDKLGEVLESSAAALVQLCPSPGPTLFNPSQPAVTKSHTPLTWYQWGGRALAMASPELELKVVSRLAGRPGDENLVVIM